MAKHTMAQVKKQIVELCNLRGCNDDETIINCLRRIDNYLDYEGSSLDVIFNCLKTALDFNSWILAWEMIEEETDKLSGKYYIEREKEQMKK